MGSVPAFMVVGAVAAVTTAPALIVDLSDVGGYQVLASARRVIATFASAYAEWTSSTLVLEALAVVAQACVLLLLALPLAAGVRSARTSSREPLTTTCVALILGLFSLPIMLWVVRIALLLWSWYHVALDWVTEFFAGGIGALIGRGILIVFGLALMVWLVVAARNSAHVRKVLLIACVTVVLAATLIQVLHPQDTNLFKGIVSAVGFMWSWLLTAIEWLLAWAFKIIITVVVVGAIIGFLAQTGTTFWLPFVAAFGAGGERSKTADLAAGAGVTASIILVVSTVRPSYEDWLSPALTHGPVGRWLEWVPTTFGPLVPHPYVEPLSGALRGFTGFPEFVVLALSCFVGVLALAFGRQDQVDDGTGAIMTFTVARTILALVMVVPLLALSALNGDTS